LHNNGYDVFFDYEGIASGDFESVILGNIRGNARKAKGDVEGALQDYNEVIRLKPDYANAYYNRAGILIRFCLF